MRRFILVLAVGVLMALMLVAMAVPAFAVANDEKASCSGVGQSWAERGDVGTAHRAEATQSNAGSVGDAHKDSNQLEGCGGATNPDGSGAPGKPGFAQGPK